MPRLQEWSQMCWWIPEGIQHTCRRGEIIFFRIYLKYKDSESVSYQLEMYDWYNVRYIIVARFSLVCQSYFMCHSLSLRVSGTRTGWSYWNLSTSPQYYPCAWVLENTLWFSNVRTCLIILNLNIFGFWAAGPDKTHMWSYPFGPLGN